MVSYVYRTELLHPPLMIHVLQFINWQVPNVRVSVEFSFEVRAHTEIRLEVVLVFFPQFLLAIMYFFNAFNENQLITAKNPTFSALRIFFIKKQILIKERCGSKWEL